MDQQIPKANLLHIDLTKDLCSREDLRNSRLKWGEGEKHVTVWNAPMERIWEMDQYNRRYKLGLKFLKQKNWNMGLMREHMLKWSSLMAQMVKKLCSAGDRSSIPGLGKSPGEGNSYPLQYSGLENSMDCIVHGVAKNQTRLSYFHFHESLKFNEIIFILLTRKLRWRSHDTSK